MAGITETKQVIDFAKALVKAIVSAQSDGSVNLLDLSKLLALVPLAGPAFLGINQVPAELKDLDQAEAQELVAYVMADLGVSDGRAKEIVESALKFALSGYELYLKIQPPAPVVA